MTDRTSKQQVGCTVTHDLKCWTEFFPAVLDGSKPFEIRENDRDYEVGHFLRLREWDREGMVYTGREVTKRVTYLTDFAQRCDYVVLGLAVETADELCHCAKPDPRQFYICGKCRGAIPKERWSSEKTGADPHG